MTNTPATRLELIIGAFILLSVLLVGGMILLFGNRSRGLFSATYKVIVDFEHVGNLRTGAPAKFGGYQIGRVADIRLAPHGIEVEVDIDKGRDLPIDTVAAISNAGLVGDTFLEFSRGTSKQHIPQESEASRAFHLKGRGLVQMNEIFEQARDIGQALLQALNNLNEVLGDGDFKGNLKKSMANIEGTTQKADEFMAGLQNTSEHILAATRNVAETTERVKSITATLEEAVQKTAGRAENIEAINASIANLRRLSESLGSRSEQIGATLDDLQVISAKGAEIARSVNPDKGVVRLLSDDSLANRLEGILSTAQEAVNRINIYIAQGLPDILTENKIADRIALMWFKQNERRYRTPEEMLKAWREWSAAQRRQHGKLPDPGPTDNR